MVASQSDNLAFGQGQFGIELETEQEYLSSLEHNPNSFMMVAIIDNQIAGLGSVAGHGRARLRHNTELGISIDEQYWQQGVGTKLLNAIIEECKATNIIENITLTVIEENLGAIKLYEKCGFKQVGKFSRMLNVEGQYKNGIIMEYLISPNLIMAKYDKHTITIDRPVGYIDNFCNSYPINCGFIVGLISGNGEEQEVYIIDQVEPQELATKYKIAIVKRLNCTDDKWVYASTDNYTAYEIYNKVSFIEQHFESKIELI